MVNRELIVMSIIFVVIYLLLPHLFVLSFREVFRLYCKLILCIFAFLNMFLGDFVIWKLKFNTESAVVSIALIEIIDITTELIKKYKNAKERDL